MIRFRMMCYTCLSMLSSVGMMATAMQPNAGVEVFFHNTGAVPPLLNMNIGNIAADVGALAGLAVAVDATQRYVGGGGYVVGNAAMNVVVPVPVLTVFQQAMLAVQRFAFGITNRRAAFHMPNVANVAAGLPGANVAAAANSLRRGGYNTFSAAFIYSCRHVVLHFCLLTYLFHLCL